ncbi:TonB-dependent receptor [Mangrovibacterium diazotrophicum]|uniref:TonB-linked SusC/RagA family outer membrane protein n=1 Tax=Mangrovibacterium diazotrophicum TaxID=1261403 RepID=A0A419VYC4_9BACT|nr:TonB-dependent receptor [Mangrovibacterium diazotrophicum]RKD88169.1 TonB-linked SusC/RagA family outer membrane protein [Mangrovibacterium diazotrophicum]
MKKNDCTGWECYVPIVTAYFRVMKLTAFFILLSCFAVTANQSYSQTTTVNLNLKNVSVKEVLSQIEDLTGYSFMYSEKLVDVERKVSITSDNKEVDDVLKTLFAGTNVEFKKTNRIITLSSSVAENAVAANLTVKGRVVDTGGAPLPGVTVIIKGTTIGTITDGQGDYTLDNVPSDATLVFSFVGMRSEEVIVAGKSNINVTLAEETIGIEEVVAIGYGTMRKQDVTGSISQAKGSELVKSQNFSALDNLRGKVSGVNIYSNSGQPGAYQSRVVIRGLSTINSKSDPLYVVDGVVMENFGLANPNDIESIEVLKDASAAAIYGARGANGVIIVTTKRGKKGGEGTTISYQGSASVSTVARYMDVLNAQEWTDAFMQGLENENTYMGYDWSLDRTDWFTDRNYFDASGNPLYDTDWQKEATRTAFSQNHQLSIQQAGATSSTGAFLNYTDLEGVVNNTYTKRLNAKVSFDATPTEWLSTAINVMVNHSWGRYTPETGGGQEARRTMIEMLPWLPVRDANGDYTTSSSSTMSDTFGFEGMSNPAMILDLQKRMNYNTQIFGNAALTFHLMEGLDLKTQFGVDNQNKTYRGYSSVSLNNISMPNGWASLQHTNTFYWQEETYLTYNKVFGLHRLNAMAGLSWQERTYNFDSSYTEGFSDDFFEWYNMGAGTTPSSPSSDYNKWAMNSYFLRFAYTYNDKYSATVTGRYDGSSKFGANNKYAFFPSAGLAWNVSQEDFLKDDDLVSNLKLHTSYGITGNSEIDPYQSLASVSSGTLLLDGSRAAYSYISSMANPDLKWEKTAQWDFGFDLGLFENRLNFDISYYHKKTTDLLLETPLPTSSGFSSIYKNIGSVQNQGLDVMIDATPVRTEDFRWNTTLNLNFNKNKILHLGENDEDIELNGWVGGSESVLRVGENLSSFYGYKRLGVYTIEDYEAGEAELSQVGRAKRTTEKEIIGKGMPDWTGSFINNFAYKNFDLTIDLQFVWGVETMQQFYHSTYDRFGITNGLSNILYDAYDGTNPNTMEQAIYLCNSGHAGQNTTVDSGWIADGSYLRANLIQLGYNIPKVKCESMGISAFRLYASVNNAFLICSDEFNGYDPESTSQGTTNKFGQNMTFFAYPRARTWTLGVNVTF